MPSIELNELTQFYANNVANLKFGHLNVNSIRHKFSPLSEVMNKNVLDILMIQETKLDESFPTAQFLVDGFIVYRIDHTDNAGGLMMLVREDLPQCRRYDLEEHKCESGRMECLVIEIIIQGRKWLIHSIYKQPIVKNNHFKTVIENVIINCNKEDLNYIICGDLNINMLKSNCLNDILDVYGCTNIVRKPTCFKSNVPTLLDVVITNVPKSLQHVTCIDCDLSDFHHMVCFATKMHAPVIKKRHITYRSYKKFDENAYSQDLANIPYQVSEVFDDVDDAYWFCQTLISQVIDEHAPLKKRIIKSNQVPYMNDQLRKAINVKNMIKRRFYKYRSKANWENYRHHRNTVNKLRKESTRQYLRDKGTMSGNGKNFWKTVKPLIANKFVSKSNVITLMENGNIVNNPNDVSNVINEYYVNITKAIGSEDLLLGTDKFEDIVKTHIANSSVSRIKDSIAKNNNFSFNLVTTEYVYTKLKNIKSKKAPGYDAIPPKLVKSGAKELCRPITYIINKCITTSTFPDCLKLAEVAPIFKKENILDKKNYRPVSILPCFSKVFESILVDQMSEFLEPMLSSHLSGFRKNHSCQNVLLQMVEKCKFNLDNHGVSGALMTDLSKAFDCLPYRLLVAKLNAYGFNQDACMLVASYFTNRYQRVKIGDVRSDWLNLTKGAPQGSIFGPFIYNLHSNDLLYLIDDLCDIYNYADDNTICVHRDNVSDVLSNIERVSEILLNWFKTNYLQANPEKFQFILLSKDKLDNGVLVDNTMLRSQECVKLLGVNIDHALTFSFQISETCKKAGRQLSALGRLSKVLKTDDKLILFECFILSHFNYCPLVWHCCSASDQNKMELVQKRALRYVYNDYSSTYKELRERANKPLLYIHRIKLIMVEIYKIINKMGPKYLHDMFTVKDNNYNVRNKLTLVLPKFNTVKYGKKSIKYEGVKFWNLLTNEVRQAINVDVFKRFLRNWQGPVCSCHNCSMCMLNSI
jgi:hypothetical protein